MLRNKSVGEFSNVSFQCPSFSFANLGYKIIDSDSENYVDWLPIMKRESVVGAMRLVVLIDQP